MALIPDSNLTGLPEITKRDMESNDPARLNRVLNLLARNLHAVQTGVPTSSTITNVTQNITGGGSSGASGGSTTVTTTGTLQGTHADRLATLASGYPQGTQYYEIDRTVTYLDYAAPSTTLVWQYLSGVMQAPLASRPNDLGQYDAGFLFYANDILVNYRWTGSAWIVFDTVASVIRDTHANRTSYPATNYPVNTLYEESDRTVFYLSRTTSGVVNTSGTAVTWVSGDMFSSTDLAAGKITINGVVYTISTVNSAVSITLTATAGVQTGKAYSTAILQWTYLSGVYSDTFANIPTLGANDIGFQFFDTTHWRLFQWAQAGAAPASTTPGWKRGAGEYPTAMVCLLPFGGGQMATGWSLCNGIAATITQDDASTTSITKPNFASGAFPSGGTTGTYSPTVVAATAPTMGGHTDFAATGISVSPAAGAAAATAGTGSVAAGTGSPVSVLVPPFTGGGGGGGGAVTDPTHDHTLSSSAVVSLPGPPVDNIVIPFYLKL